MKSMTGFGSASTHFDGIDIEVSLKTVNGRYFDLKHSIPQEYANIEPQIKRLTSDELKRGTVHVTVHRRVGPDARSTQVVVNSDRARLWVEGYQELGKKLKLLADPTLETVARIPEVLQVFETNKVEPKEQGLVLKTVAEALKSCNQERVREGVFLQRELGRLLNELSQRVRMLRSLSKKNGLKIRRDFQTKLKNLGVKDRQDARWVQEAVTLADRADVTEELSRLSEHIKTCQSLIKSKAVVGKKLDFYTQELLRECNTVGSKSQMAEMTRIVIDSKSFIEQFREQVQNVE